MGWTWCTNDGLVWFDFDTVCSYIPLQQVYPYYHLWSLSLSTSWSSLLLKGEVNQKLFFDILYNKSQQLQNFNLSFILLTGKSKKTHTFSLTVSYILDPFKVKQSRTKCGLWRQCIQKVEEKVEGKVKRKLQGLVWINTHFRISLQYTFNDFSGCIF